MIKFENTEVMGWEAAIRGMRNPMNSWDRSDSCFGENCSTHYCSDFCGSSECEGNGYPKEMSYDEIKPKDKGVWWQMIQLLPSSYNQKRTVMMNYEVLANIYKSRKNHKLDEWSEHKVELVGDCPSNMYPSSLINYTGFCDWIKTLPYSELITMEGWCQ